VKELVAESDWARNMRREAEKQTIFASDQAHYAAEAANAQQDAAREASYAAAAAARSEENSELLLEEQRRLSRQNSAHNFAMWRQTTLNGESYDRWLIAACPLVDEFSSRWHQWTAAKDADIARIRAAKAEESLSRFNVNTRAYKKILLAGGSWERSKSRGSILTATAAACLLLLLVVTGIGGFFNHSWWDVARTATPVAFYVWVAYLALELFVMMPRANKTVKANNDARDWQKTEVAAFESSLPQNWRQDGDESIWNQMVAAEATVNSMPKKYLEFSPQMLTDLPLGLPRARSSSSIPPEAARTRELLDTWAAMSVPPSHSAV
jgi:hypothetical protein